ncbi:MAG: hypothetical protein ACOVP4_03920 [Bacteriovoracaceae bacterium]|jgi:hypothetical protein
MSMPRLELALTMIQNEYKLSPDQILKIKRRLLADDKEFERVWMIYQDKIQRKGVDKFKDLLTELLT